MSPLSKPLKLKGNLFTFKALPSPAERQLAFALASKIAEYGAFNTQFKGGSVAIAVLAGRVAHRPRDDNQVRPDDLHFGQGRYALQDHRLHLLDALLTLLPPCCSFRNWDAARHPPRDVAAWKRNRRRPSGGSGIIRHEQNFFPAFYYWRRWR